MATPTDRAAVARAEHERRSAARAVDDPRQLQRAARIIRIGLERRAISLADILPIGGPDDEAA
jgi:hypothetical protein